MTRTEREGIGRLLEALTVINNPAEARQRVLHALCLTSGAQWGHLADQNATLRKRSLVDTTWGQLDNVALTAKAHKHFTWKNPIAPRRLALQGKVVRNSEVVGEQDWFESEFHVDFSKRICGMTDVVSLYVPAGADRRWSVGFAHAKRNGIGYAAIKTLQWLLPNLQRGLANLDAWETKWRSVQLLNEQMAEPLVLVQTPAGRAKLLMASGGAAQLLGLKGGGAERNLCLHEFLRLCVKACGPRAGTILWKAHDGRLFRLAAFKTAADAPLMVRFSAETPATPSLADNTAAALRRGLTPREADVFARLAHGLGDREIARDLGLSASTVRTHLRHLFGKLNASNRIEAVNAVRTATPPSHCQ